MSFRWCFSGLIVVWVAIFSISRADIRIVGTDLMAEAISGPVRAFSDASGLTVKVSMEGTLPGQRAFSEGAAEIFIAASPEGDFPLQAGLVVKALAHQVAVVVVHESNPLDEITLQQLARLYGGQGGSQTLRWNELGVAGLMASSTIRTVIYDSRTNLLGELVRAKALDRAPFRETLERLRTLPRAYEVLSSDASAIGILPRYPSQRGMKVLRVGGNSRDDIGFDPNPDNVYYGSYQLRLPFFLVFRTEDWGLLQPLITLLYGSDFASVLEQSDLQPLSENLRQRIILELNALPK